METMTLNELQGYLIYVVAMAIGAIVLKAKDIVIKRLKEKYAIDDVIDEGVKVAEATINGIGVGPLKKKKVLEEVEKHLKNEGVGLLKRFVIGKFGGVGSSVDKAAKRFFK